MRNIFLTLSFVFTCLVATAQTGIGTPTPHESAQLHIEATDKGILIPQVSIESLTDTASIDATTIEESLLIFNPVETNGVKIGYYYWLDGKWEFLAPNSGTYANVFYDGDDFFYRDEDGEEQPIDIETLIQSKQKTYAVEGGNAYVNVTEEVDPNNANHTTFKIDVKAAMPQFFYMPALLFDTSTTGSFTKDLYQEYVGQFGTPLVKNGSAPNAIPHLPNAEDLHYYITHFDDTVIDSNSITINDQGVVSYEVIGNAGPYSFMTIIFVVKED